MILLVEYADNCHFELRIRNHGLLETISVALSVVTFVAFPYLEVLPLL